MINLQFDPTNLLHLLPKLSMLPPVNVNFCTNPLQYNYSYGSKLIFQNKFLQSSKLSTRYQKLGKNQHKKV
jgi:hypothetical protein